MRLFVRLFVRFFFIGGARRRGSRRRGRRRTLGRKQNGVQACIVRKHNARLTSVKRTDLASRHRQCVKPDQVPPPPFWLAKPTLHTEYSSYISHFSADRDAVESYTLNTKQYDTCSNIMHRMVARSVQAADGKIKSPGTAPRGRAGGWVGGGGAELRGHADAGLSVEPSCAPCCDPPSVYIPGGRPLARSVASKSSDGLVVARAVHSWCSFPAFRCGATGV